MKTKQEQDCKYTKTETKNLIMLLKKTKVKSARLKLLSATLIKLHMFWNITSCRLVCSYRRFGEDYCPYLRGSNNPKKLLEPLGGPKNKNRTSSEMFITIYQSILRHIQDAFNFEIGDIALQLECQYVCRALRPKNHL
jgi:hypothetical protein